jgi:hypothetical protein
MTFSERTELSLEHWALMIMTHLLITLRFSRTKCDCLDQPPKIILGKGSIINKLYYPQ